MKGGNVKMKIEKIEDKSLNLDVQGQGCWNDCFIAAHYEQKTQNVKGCIFYEDKDTSKTWFMW